MKTATINRSTTASLEAVCARLPDIAKRHEFGVLGVHDLKEKMNSKGVPFERECRVIEICNPQQARTILQGSMEIAAALPCRISAYADNGRTVLVTIEPGALLSLFGNHSNAAAEVAGKVRESLVAIMDEACAGSV